jgi:8-oxo-dGTP diphosphatase
MRAVTLLFPIDLERRLVLLGEKRRGFGTGKLVGIGGGIESGETPPVAAIRELLEEAGLTVRLEDVVSAGRLRFRFTSNPSWDMDVHLFTTRCWTGEPRDSLELRPEWHGFDALPWTRMWDDGPYWLTNLLRGETIHAECVYAEDNERVSSFSRREATI